jgi:hypothetical protein
VIKEFLIGRAHNIVNLIDLIELIVAWEERKEREDLKKYATGPPNIHLVPIIAVSKQTLRGSVPPR